MDWLQFHEAASNAIRRLVIKFSVAAVLTHGQALVLKLMEVIADMSYLRKTAQARSYPSSHQHLTSAPLPVVHIQRL
jgi:hypothetical protein